MKNKFKPTQNMVDAAEKVFMLMALHELVKPLEIEVRKIVLEWGNFHYSEKYYTEKMRAVKGWDYPEDRIMRPQERDNTYMMQGVDLYGQDGYEQSDAALYHYTMDLAMKERGVINGVNGLSIIESKLADAKRELAHVMEPITKISVENATWNLQLYRQLIELTLQLLVPFVGRIKADFEAKKRKLFNEHISESSVLKSLPQQIAGGVK